MSSNLEEQLNAMRQAFQQKEAELQQALQQKDEVIKKQAEVIEQKDGERQQHAAELQQKDEVIKKQAEVIEQKDEVIEQKDEVIKEQDEALEYQSLAKMLRDYKGLPDMPRVRELGPHVHSGHADFTIDYNFVTDDHLRFEIWCTSKTSEGKERNVPALLLSNNTPDPVTGTLSYLNEATVADYVQQVVSMCLKSLGIFESTKLFKEMSMFSQRPDIILLRLRDKGVVLVIEVKMPGEELKTSGGIAKQVADYLVLLYRLGNTMPFVLLSSYREACLCRLDSTAFSSGEAGESQSGEAGESPYKVIVEDAAKLLKGDDKPDLSEYIQEEEAEQTKPGVSPTKRSFVDASCIPSVLPRPDERGRGKRKRTQPSIHKVSPSVVYSESFGLHNMMQGVNLSIVASLMALSRQDMKSTDCVWPRHNDQINGLHPEVESKSLGWASVSDMCIDYMEPPLKPTSKYYLIQEIGRGKNGQVYLGVDGHGRACALKFYVGNSDSQTGYSQAQRKAAEDEEFQELQPRVEEEARRWILLQPDEYKDYIEAKELNGLNVLQMPVFAPVPTESRPLVLDDVKNLLIKFAEAGFVYPDEVRWQHIGCRQIKSESESKLKVVLLDLESLDQTELSEKRRTEYADRHIGKLRQRMKEVAKTSTDTLLQRVVD